MATVCVPNNISNHRRMAESCFLLSHGDPMVVYWKLELNFCENQKHFGNNSVYNRKMKTYAIYWLHMKVLHFEKQEWMVLFQ